MAEPRTRSPRGGPAATRRFPTTVDGYPRGMSQPDPYPPIDVPQDPLPDPEPLPQPPTPQPPIPDPQPI
jgi:hypothetical protein